VTSSLPVRTIERPAEPAVAVARGIIAALRRWIAKASLDKRTRYLCEAADHVDLEWRLKNWEKTERGNSPFRYYG
jgi:hypothetical protein